MIFLFFALALAREPLVQSFDLKAGSCIELQYICDAAATCDFTFLYSTSDGTLLSAIAGFSCSQWAEGSTFGILTQTTVGGSIASFTLQSYNYLFPVTVEIAMIANRCSRISTPVLLHNATKVSARI
jgi:hypothetical protein